MALTIRYAVEFSRSRCVQEFTPRSGSSRHFCPNSSCLGWKRRDPCQDLALYPRPRPLGRGPVPRGATLFGVFRVALTERTLRVDDGRRQINRDLDSVTYVTWLHLELDVAV
ncbi:hypothetical protein FRAHR75_380067 [Frankia sp. Hr75.2]|nr:hypothetical protein FRAHR75_380067 [Frankia sp. Hr75.2]